MAIMFASASALAGNVPAQVDRLMQQYHELGQFNGAALVLDAETTVLRKGYGFANTETEVLNTPDTRFGVGSMSKSFTALVILQLAEQGKLDLDDTIADHMPDYRRDVGESATLRQLLAHTDGIPNYTQNADFKRPFEGMETTAEYIARYCSGDPAFAPGTQYRYGNAGYSILGAIVERVAGKPFDEVVAEQVLEPLDLTRTGFIRHGTSIDGMSDGYEQSVGGFRPVTPLPRRLFAAGSMYSTIDDVAAYGRAVVDSAFVSATTKDALLGSRHGAVEGTFAFGWNAVETELGGAIERQPFVATSGELNGFNSLFVYLPENEQVVVLLNNTGETNLVQMAINILGTINGQPPAQPEPRLRDTLYRLLGEGSMDAVADFYRSEREKGVNDYIFAPWALRIVAIQLSEDGRIDDAITMLTLNLETNPDDAASGEMLSDLRDRQASKPAPRQ